MMNQQLNQEREFSLQKKDLVLLYALRENARLTLTQISKKTRIPISTLHDRLKSQEKTIIHKYAALVDFAKMGYTTRVHLQLKVLPEKRAELTSHLLLHKQVNCVYKITHEFDFAIEAVFQQVTEVASFIEELENQFGLLAYKTQYVTKDIKREGFLASS